jgi:PAS domain S-box-containing protein
MPSSSRFVGPDRRVSHIPRLRGWWRSLTPQWQDRYALLAPLASVLLFFAAIVSAFSYLRLEEMEREQEGLKRDVEYAQQQIRLRLIERQDQLVRLARETANGELDTEEFVSRAENLAEQYPELQILSWIDKTRTIKASYAVPSIPDSQLRLTGNALPDGVTSVTFEMARDMQQPIYGQPAVERATNLPPERFPRAAPTNRPGHLLELHVPLPKQAKVKGELLAEYSIDSLLQLGVAADIWSKYAVAMLDADGQVLAGSSVPLRAKAAQLLPWKTEVNAYSIPVSPVGQGMVIRAQAWRTSLGVIGSGLFWLVGALSVLTVWMLIGTWRHTRKRLLVQQALITETNFRRPMENSMPTGMRAMDLQGRVTYVNAAFCQMTGWTESELVGRTAPFPYWPEADREQLAARLDEELKGQIAAGGFQMRVKRSNGTLFDARVYVSPLVDAYGVQTGWMASMTDITEPNRIREQLSASYERFTTVLEALDAAVSVAPLGNKELLYANKLYQQWFGQDTQGHSQLVTQAGSLQFSSAQEASDDVDSLVGLPTDSLTDAQAQSTEIFIPALDKWLEVRARYLTWVDGRLAQMVIATNITPRRLAEESSAAQAERAQAASRLITMGEMVSSVAHELNQPLTAINNYCSGMVSRVKSKQLTDEDLIAALEKTARQAQRAGQIIQRIRSFVKRSEPNRTESDVVTMVNEAIELAGIEMRRRNVYLNPYLAARLPPLNVDPILIEQVLVNLLKNAAESVDNAQRPAGRRRVELRVIPRMEGTQAVVEFSVIDTGKGLAPEVMERLYEAFFSTKAEGMGIGLNLCRTIVESHQGRMNAENIYNGTEVKGCQFSFWLPVGKPTTIADARKALGTSTAVKVSG